jgi:ferredoxin
MRVEVNLDTCQAYANCVIEAPDIFDVDEETSKAVVLIAEVPPELAEDACRAEANCPVKAITLVV